MTSDGNDDAYQISSLALSGSRHRDLMTSEDTSPAHCSSHFSKRTKKNLLSSIFTKRKGAKEKEEDQTKSGVDVGNIPQRFLPNPLTYSTTYHQYNPIPVATYHQPNSSPAATCHQPNPINAATYHQPNPIPAATYHQPDLLASATYQQPENDHNNNNDHDNNYAHPLRNDTIYHNISYSNKNSNNNHSNKNNASCNLLVHSDRSRARGRLGDDDMARSFPRCGECNVASGSCVVSHCRECGAVSMLPSASRSSRSEGIPGSLSATGSCNSGPSTAPAGIEKGSRNVASIVTTTTTESGGEWRQSHSSSQSSGFDEPSTWPPADITPSSTVVQHPRAPGSGPPALGPGAAAPRPPGRSGLPLAELSGERQHGVVNMDGKRPQDVSQRMNYTRISVNGGKGERKIASEGRSGSEAEGEKNVYDEFSGEGEEGVGEEEEEEEVEEEEDEEDGMEEKFENVLHVGSISDAYPHDAKLLTSHSEPAHEDLRFRRPVSKLEHSQNVSDFKYQKDDDDEIVAKNTNRWLTRSPSRAGNEYEYEAKSPQDKDSRVSDGTKRVPHISYFDIGDEVDATFDRFVRDKNVDGVRRLVPDTGDTTSYKVFLMRPVSPARRSNDGTTTTSWDFDTTWATSTSKTKEVKVSEDSIKRNGMTVEGRRRQNNTVQGLSSAPHQRNRDPAKRLIDANSTTATALMAATQSNVKACSFSLSGQSTTMPTATTAATAGTAQPPLTTTTNAATDVATSAVQRVERSKSDGNDDRNRAIHLTKPQSLQNHSSIPPHSAPKLQDGGSDCVGSNGWISALFGRVKRDESGRKKAPPPITEQSPSLTGVKSAASSGDKRSGEMGRDNSLEPNTQRTTRQLSESLTCERKVLRGNIQSSTTVDAEEGGGEEVQAPPPVLRRSSSVGGLASERRPYGYDTSVTSHDVDVVFELKKQFEELNASFRTKRRLSSSTSSDASQAAPTGFSHNRRSNSSASSSSDANPTSPGSCCSDSPTKSSHQALTAALLKQQRRSAAHRTSYSTPSPAPPQRGMSQTAAAPPLPGNSYCSMLNSASSLDEQCARLRQQLTRGRESKERPDSSTVGNNCLMDSGILGTVAYSTMPSTISHSKDMDTALGTTDPEFTASGNTAILFRSPGNAGEVLEKNVETSSGKNGRTRSASEEDGTVVEQDRSTYMARCSSRRPTSATINDTGFESGRPLSRSSKYDTSSEFLMCTQPSRSASQQRVNASRLEGIDQPRNSSVDLVHVLGSRSADVGNQSGASEGRRLKASPITSTSNLDVVRGARSRPRGLPIIPRSLAASPWTASKDVAATTAPAQKQMSKFTAIQSLQQQQQRSGSVSFDKSDQKSARTGRRGFFMTHNGEFY